MERAHRAREAGLQDDQIVLDAGLDLGKTAAQSMELLQATDVLASLGWPLLLSASNKTFLGVEFGLEIGDRLEATTAAHSVGVALGARILRAHDVRAARRVAETLAAVLEAE